MPTTTPNGHRYPASTDTPNVPRDIQRLAEDTELSDALYSAVPYFGKPYIFSGGTIGNPGGLFASVTAGVANINGFRFAFTAPANLALAASATNHIWLVQTLTGGRHTGYSWQVLQTTAVPANAVYVGQVVTGASAQTSLNTSFRGVIAPGGLIQETLKTAAVAGVTTTAQIMAMTNPVMGDGITPIRVTAHVGQVTVGTGGAWADMSLRQTAPSLAVVDLGQCGNPRSNGNADASIAAFLGPRSYDVAAQSSSGSSDWNMSASAPGLMRATWNF